MRLFTAIALPEDARDAIRAEQLRLTAGASPSRLRLISPDQLHVTLVFIGEVDRTLALAITEAMEAPFACEPFRIVFGGVGVFPETGAPRVLWLGLRSGRREMAALRQQVAARLDALAVPIEARAFDPHVTLGRWKASRGSDRRTIDSATGQIAGVDVRAVTLFESRPSSTGQIYSALAQSALTLPASP